MHFIELVQRKLWPLQYADIGNSPQLINFINPLIAPW
jgi:hypothetical protein